MQRYLRDSLLLGCATQTVSLTVLILVSALWFSEDFIPSISHWKELPLIPALLYLYLHLPLPLTYPSPRASFPSFSGWQITFPWGFAWDVFIARTCHCFCPPQTQTSWITKYLSFLYRKKKYWVPRIQATCVLYPDVVIHAVVTEFCREGPRKVGSFFIEYLFARETFRGFYIGFLLLLLLGILLFWFVLQTSFYSSFIIYFYEFKLLLYSF